MIRDLILKRTSNDSKNIKYKPKLPLWDTSILKSILQKRTFLLFFPDNCVFDELNCSMILKSKTVVDNKYSTLVSLNDRVRGIEFILFFLLGLIMVMIKSVVK